jgi:hypothetical protein
MWKAAYISFGKHFSKWVVQKFFALVIQWKENAKVIW